MYQFPMGKVKTTQERQKLAEYQFPMGKVKKLL